MRKRLLIALLLSLGLHAGVVTTTRDHAMPSSSRIAQAGGSAAPRAHTPVSEMRGSQGQLGLRRKIDVNCFPGTD